MELKNFISETLVQISEGVSMAQQKVSAYGSVINPSVKNVNQTHPLYHGTLDVAPYATQKAFLCEFDIALLVEDKKTDKLGAGIFVAPFGLGGESSDSSTKNVVSRIKFVVPYSLGIQEK
jgi:hypothetical protein